MQTTMLLVLTALSLAGCGRGQESESSGHEKDHAGLEEEHEESEHIDHTTIAKETADEVGIRTATVTSGLILDTHEVQGLLTPVEGRHARIRARFPGPVQSVSVGVGDHVTKGQPLAVIESNVSLSAYTVVAPFAGTILDVDVGAGDLAGEEPLLELADLSSLWVDMHLFGSDAQHITPGLPVQITRLSDGAQVTTKLDRILPSTATASQSTVARATISNADRQWRPGTAVRARVTVSERAAALVVPVAALQSIDNATVVFVRNADTYTARPVRLGARDADSAEVLAGLQAGEEIVVEQSYTIKADLEKASAAHED
jgi:cobalt-zinc-cadmium efflux system membrane fusion protein